MELKPKITLKQKGDTASLQLKPKGATSVHAQLTWTQAVDLDLHCFYRTKEGEFGHVFFGNKGKREEAPYIMLDEDAGVGNTAGDNEENIRIERLDHLDSLIIATNIFRFLGFLSKGDNFAKYDGRVVVTTNAGDVIEVPLTSEQPGKWCIIARIDNTGVGPQIINVNQVQKEEPDKDML